MLAYYKCTCLLSMWLPHIPTYTRRNGARFLPQIYRKDTSVCLNNLISISVTISISARSWFVGAFDCRQVGLSASWSVGELVVGELVCRRVVQLLPMLPVCVARILYFTSKLMYSCMTYIIRESSKCVSGVLAIICEIYMA